MVDPHLKVFIEVLWVLTPMYVASATATLPRGRGPKMDGGRSWPWDGERILGDSKTWSGFLCGSAIAFLVALLQAWLYLIAPPDLRLVPSYGSSLVLAVPVALILSAGAMSGDALGSFIKRRLGRPNGSRALLIDQLPFVLVPIGLGLLLVPAPFWEAYGSLEALAWLLVLTLGFHAAFNWVGYWAGLKKVPW